MLNRTTKIVILSNGYAGVIAAVQIAGITGWQCETVMIEQMLESCKVSSQDRGEFERTNRTSRD